MGIFDKFENMQGLHKEIVAAAGIDPLSVRIEKIFSPTSAQIEGHKCVLMGSNNYLGLTYDETAIESACEALRQSGTGTTGSRVANGSYSAHQNLELQIADFYGKKHAVLFTTGYQANIGFISAIADKDDVILIDADSHASIYDGCKMGNATVIRFKHNDPDDLERRLKRLPADVNKLVIVEGVYSMLGDKAPLKRFVEVTKKYGGYIMVDEAHSLGVFGETGRGLVQEEGVEDDVDFVLGTFSKSVGTIGGFCVSNHEGLNMVRFAARSYVFTASLPPSVIASASETLSRIGTDKSIREKLWQNTDMLYDGLKSMGFQVGPDKTPVIGVFMPDLTNGLMGWRFLIENGVYVNLALPPATPKGTCLLRCSVNTAHSVEDIQKVLDTFAALKEQMPDMAVCTAAVAAE